MDYISKYYGVMEQAFIQSPTPERREMEAWSHHVIVHVVESRTIGIWLCSTRKRSILEYVECGDGSPACWSLQISTTWESCIVHFHSC